MCGKKSESLNQGGKMKVEIILSAIGTNEVVLPRINLNILQSFVYSIFSPERARFLHDSGYQYQNRKFKLFTFSWLVGKKKRIEEKHIVFQSPVKLVLSSPLTPVLEDLASGALNKEQMRLGNNNLICNSVKVFREPETTEDMRVKALSPITCYSTMYKKDGTPYTVYYSPFEEEFKEQIHNNLVKKFSLVFPEKNLPESKVVIKPIGKPRLQVALFRADDPRPIKGWWGNFRLTGPKELLSVAIDAGLGAKNSSGWGCVTPIKGRDEPEGA
jgi:CRISPR-associated endoribonuclease Cas6